jgi:hypothetical protein
MVTMGSVVTRELCAPRLRASSFSGLDVVRRYCCRTMSTPEWSAVRLK